MLSPPTDPPSRWRKRNIENPKMIFLPERETETKGKRERERVEKRVFVSHSLQQHHLSFFLFPFPSPLPSFSSPLRLFLFVFINHFSSLFLGKPRVFIKIYLSLCYGRFWKRKNRFWKRFSLSLAVSKKRKKKKRRYSLYRL